METKPETTQETTEFMGFRVEWTGNEQTPAIFHGKQGATYGAVRSSHMPLTDWCFLVDVGHRTPGMIRRIRGNSWVLIPANTNTITGAK